MAVQELKNLATTNNFQYCLNFAEKYEMELPCKTVAEFTAFDEKLKEDKTFRDNFVNFLFKCNLKVFMKLHIFNFTLLFV